MKTPALLLRIQNCIKSVINPDCFDEFGNWKGFDVFFSVAYDRKSSKTARKKAAISASKLLLPLSVSGCRKGWTNFDWCPPSPLGDYHVCFTVPLVLNLIDMSPALVEGFKWWENHREPYRDANPYNCSSSSEQWDFGYIIGHGWHYKSDSIKDWCKAIESRQK